MDWHDVHKLLKDLEVTRVFLFEIATRQDQFEISGLGGLKSLDGFEEAVASLRNLESRLADFTHTVRFVAPELFGKIVSLTEESPLSVRAPEIALAIEIADKRQLPSKFFTGTVRAASMVYGPALKRNIFSENGEIPLRKMLVDLDRLIPFVQSVEKKYWSRTEGREEKFKPSGIDPEKILVHIEKAIIAIRGEASLANDERENLIEYLLETQAELAKPDPSWKKIVGALAIVATLLSGLAVAPEAFENVNSAMNYLLGTAFDGVNSQGNGGIDLLPPVVDT